jgi:hypothetical protein
MTPKEIKKFYGSLYRFNKDTGMSPSSLGNWLKWGYVPFESQGKIEQLTKGLLKAEWKHGKPT